MIIDDVIQVLSTLPYLVTQAKIDPYTAGQEELPAINVKYISEKLESIGHAPDYLVHTNIAIGVFVGDTNNYYVELKNIVEEIKNALFTNAAWFSEFRRVPNVSISYEYEDGGETNYGAAYFNLEIETTNSYQPVITNTLSTVDLCIDDGPQDGVIDIESVFNIPQ